MLGTAWSASASSIRIRMRSLTSSASCRGSIHRTDGGASNSAASVQGHPPVTVIRLAKGRYRVFVDLGRDADGRRRRHTEVIRGTKAEADQRERELRRAQHTVTVVDPRSGRVAE